MSWENLKRCLAELRRLVPGEVFPHFTGPVRIMFRSFPWPFSSSVHRANENIFESILFRASMPLAHSSHNPWDWQLSCRKPWIFSVCEILLWLLTFFCADLINQASSINSLCELEFMCKTDLASSLSPDLFSPQYYLWTLNPFWYCVLRLKQLYSVCSLFHVLVFWGQMENSCCHYQEHWQPFLLRKKHLNLHPFYCNLSLIGQGVVWDTIHDIQKNLICINTYKHQHTYHLMEILQSSLEHCRFRK